MKFFAYLALVGVTTAAEMNPLHSRHTLVHHAPPKSHDFVTHKTHKTNKFVAPHKTNKFVAPHKTNKYVAPRRRSFVSV